MPTEQSVGTKQKCWILFAKKWRKIIAENCWKVLAVYIRFFVMISPEIRNSSSHQISLKKSLNDYMGRHKDADVTMIESLRTSFIHTIDKISETWGEVAFRNYNKDKFSSKFHPAIYDAVMVGFYDILQQGSSIVHADETVHITLLCNDNFKDATSKRTTDLENIRLRIKLVKDALLGES